MKKGSEEEERSGRESRGSRSKDETNEFFQSWFTLLDDLEVIRVIFVDSKQSSEFRNRGRIHRRRKGGREEDGR